MTDAIYKLQPAIKQYAWGKLGNESLVASFALANADSNNSNNNETNSINNINIKNDEPYAELWFGAHPSGPANVLVNNEWRLLSDLIETNPIKFLGETVSKQYDNSIPFLFKVLAVGKALSIQAHPDKALAQQLHAQRPAVYKDANHKPEMAIALTPFEALCGFRPLSEIVTQLDSTPELERALGDSVVTALRDAAACSDNDSACAAALRSALDALLRPEAADDIAALVAQLSERARGQPTEALCGRAELVARLHDSYPGDVGVFCSLLLNYLRLSPGQGIYLGANEPHAYLDGNCIEAMACSDNVVRAGLTPKLKDAETLCAMLTYNARHVVPMSGRAVPHDAERREYSGEAPEFAVTRVATSAEQSGEALVLAPVDGPSIVLVVAGAASFNGVTVTRVGTSLFVPHNVTLTFVASQPLVFYRCATMQNVDATKSQ